MNAVVGCYSTHSDREYNAVVIAGLTHQNEQDYSRQMEEETRTEELRLAVLHFEELPDPRLERSKQHSLVNVIVIALSAVIAGAESFYEIESFGHTKRAWLEQFLELENGIPSHDTFNRVFSLLEGVLEFSSSSLTH